MSDSKVIIGFAGIGTMGRPMARNLRKAGHEVVAFDVSAEASRGFVEDFGGTAAAGPADFADVDVLVTMLPDGRAVTEALFETGGGIATGLRRGAVVLEMSSSSPLDTLALGPRLAERGVALVDAPVSGGRPRAETGELTLMIGGDDDAAIERAWPVLEVLGANLVRTGPLGSGHAMKALNNYLGAAAYAAAAEALAVGQRFGLTGETMLSVINTSTGRSFTSDFVFGGHVVTGAYATGFSLPLLTKDVGIAASLAKSTDLDTPVVGLVSERWAQALAALGPDHDHSEAHKGWWNVELAG